MRSSILPVATFAALLLLDGAMSMDCPGRLTESTSLGDGTVTFHYAIVHSLNEGESILCGRLESDSESWVAFGVSPDGTMNGGEAIIGLPDSGTVQKFDLSNARVNLMEPEKQTLMHNNVTQMDGKTVMEFAKFLKEDGENEIMAYGENVFLWAVGTYNQLARHAKRDSFVLDFDATRKPSSSVTPAPVYGGDEEGTSMGLIRTLSPTGGYRRPDSPAATPVPSTETEVTPSPVEDASIPPVGSPGPAPAETPSAAWSMIQNGLVQSGLWAATLLWFSL